VLVDQFKSVLSQAMKKDQSSKVKDYLKCRKNIVDLKAARDEQKILVNGWATYVSEKSKLRIAKCKETEKKEEKKEEKRRRRRMSVRQLEDSCDDLKEKLRNAIRSWQHCSSSNIIKLVGAAVIALFALFN